MKKIILTLALILSAQQYNAQFGSIAEGLINMNSRSKQAKKQKAKEIKAEEEADVTIKEAMTGNVSKNAKLLAEHGVIVSKQYDNLVKTHKKVAILPFSISLKDETNSKQSKKENVQNQKETMEVLQEGLYNYLLKNHHDYSVEFQDIERTNQILKSSGIMNTLKLTSKEEIAEALGVDAIISGEYVKAKSKEGMINFMKSIADNTGELDSNKSETIKLTLYDGKSGDMVWKMDRQEKEKYPFDIFDEPEKVMDLILEKVTSYFPYRTK